MQLRPRQKDFVDRCIDALAVKRNTLGVAPTGAGKTVMLSAVIKRLTHLGERALVLQHRDELVAQNRATFRAVAPEINTDLYTAGRKMWSDGVTFGMIQTLSRPENLASMPKLDLVVIDEAHHVAAASYKAVLKAARDINPRVKVFGVTATPQRGDHLALVDTFTNIADIITLTELISSGFLVKPRFFVIDCNIQEELSRVKVTTNDFDMAEVAEVMDKQVVTDRVIDEWRSKAGSRKTVIFCSTVVHAEHVMAAFQAAGLTSDLIHGDLADGARKKVLTRFDRGEIQVLVNVAVLTEGWDCQDVSCVVLLRPCSYKSTMIQMIGRGLRKVDPERYPGVVKSDCVVLDFGYSILTHGSIDSDAAITQDREKGDNRIKSCPGCGVEIPIGVGECPVCGFAPEPEGEMGIKLPKMPLSSFKMTEIHLMDLSPYRWQDMFDGAVTMATGITAWACLVNHGDQWYSVARFEGGRVKILQITDDKISALASADDFLRVHGDKDAARKTKRWLSEPASEKQLAVLGMANSIQFGMTKYLACCLMTWRFNERDIQRVILR
ncbi:SSL2 DNA or RNA helicases of superfamily II [uncultured Caudovirales phage]|uniref:SSL2 DNA or RNA helicases of superfamily II n=1 Tax=uncultured Caudovirales phage TaxID=2100421 RepID=A0A6J5SEV1_9CAUD|nr:SSL2 DNA or RNA helicases of superfamily II [uncultured Caudovirales phage]CAB4212334.1 SSL2 DNA or RNA helicases of superfamily II [uncultured Caudovirales phage]CAB5228005.1 SSL2 DNA or RNA helicases of superfamily II [uncultured Caudovirales phage]